LNSQGKVTPDFKLMIWVLLQGYRRCGQTARGKFVQESFSF
jgi:hypothetical protein